jgi:acetoin utilization protein AcuB
MLVKDRMSPNPVSISPDTNFPDAYQIIREKEIRHIPVVDENNKLAGITTQADMLRASPSVTTPLSVFEMNYLLANLHISEVMSSPAITIPEGAPLEEAARIMVEKKIGCLPVMRDDALVGIITETDIFETFLEILEGECASLRVTVKVKDVRGELARLSGEIAQIGGHICSVARFRTDAPEDAFITLRLSGVEEEPLLEMLKDKVEEIVHVCCVT